MTKANASFRSWLKQRRKAMRLTQASLARQIHCSTSMLQKIEAGKRQPSRQTASLLAEALDIPPNRKQAFINFTMSSLGMKGEIQLHPPNNLPAQVTPLIGRQRDLAALRRKLIREDNRLVTILGPPGIGKTRLGIEVAHELLYLFEDGVYFVPLATIRDPDLLPSAITQHLKIQEGSHWSPIDHLSEYLRDKNFLLILDNFEQIVAAAPVVAQLLTRCPLLKILVTSRATLLLRAERRFYLTPLELPDLENLPKIGVLANYPAVALFLDRAQAIRPEFALTEENAIAIADICNHLDGLPLAIELIAPRIEVLPPESLLERLSRHMILYSDGLSDLDERQRTLKNAIGWSYMLLTPGEQALFARLSVFVGGWTLDAVEYLWAGFHNIDSEMQNRQFRDSPTFLQTDLTEAFHLLYSLVDKNLVSKRDEDGETRFSMLETIRHYAHERVEVRTEMEAAQHLHAGYFLELTEAAVPKLHQSLRFLGRLELENTNLQAALRWLLDQEQIEEAARLGCAAAYFWSIHARHLGEGRRWLAEILSLAETNSLSIPIHISLLNWAGTLAYLQGDYTASFAFHNQALSSARTANEQLLIAYSLHGLSNVAMNQGHYNQVENLLDECLPLARAEGDRWLIGMALNNLGETMRLQGDFERAVPMFQEGLVNLKELDDKVFSAILLDNLGSILQARQDYKQALEIHCQCLRLAYQAGDYRVTALSLEKLAGIASALGYATRAAKLLGAAEALRQVIASPIETLDLPEYERILAGVRSSLDQAAFTATTAEGRFMTLETAVAYALETTAG